LYFIPIIDKEDLPM